MLFQSRQATARGPQANENIKALKKATMYNIDVILEDRAALNYNNTHQSVRTLIEI